LFKILLRASAIPGILSAWASLPFENAKIKIQKIIANADGTFPYKNIFDAIGKVSNHHYIDHRQLRSTQTVGWIPNVCA
jgi:hypothetical protein